MVFCDNTVLYNSLVILLHTRKLDSLLKLWDYGFVVNFGRMLGKCIFMKSNYFVQQNCCYNKPSQLTKFKICTLHKVTKFILLNWNREQENWEQAEDRRRLSYTIAKWENSKTSDAGLKEILIKTCSWLAQEIQSHSFLWKCPYWKMQLWTWKVELRILASSGWTRIQSKCAGRFIAQSYFSFFVVFFSLFFPSR